MSVVEARGVDVVFGRRQEEALRLLDEGLERGAILERTGAVIGVADANLSVEEGEICVLMGLSGSGKSSLLRCVNGLNQISRGALLVRHDGKDIDVARCSAATLRALRTSRIAMVFQQFGLLPWRSVRENVGFGLELRGVARAQIRQIVDEKLALVHLQDWADKPVSSLSGGMQQRVGLARAFATDGDILLMDEPFSALDPLIRHHLQDELLALQSSLRKTIVFVSHDLDEALKIGNQIVIMDGGRIVQQGRPEDIVFNPVNDYVRAFVANMNPLQVLTARALMRPLTASTTQKRTLSLEDGIELTLDERGAVQGAALGAQSLVLQALGGAGSNAIEFATPDTGMRALVASRRTHGRPILIVDDGHLVGVVSERELYDGLLRQTGE